MRAAFIQNKYYTDAGMDYVFSRLSEEFGRLGVELSCPRLFVTYGEQTADVTPYAFAVFWDKDLPLAYSLQRRGIRLFNSAAAVEACDDKQKTYAALCGQGIALPQTVVAPLAYDVCPQPDREFLRDTATKLGFPLVVKQCVGSQGKQVYLAHNEQELLTLAARLWEVPHLYQRFLAGSVGCDTRVYLVGGKAVAAVRRTNTTDFHSNVSLGGVMTRTEPSPELQRAAERAATLLGLDYGAADFMIEDGAPLLIEVNSNAYFRAIEGLGVNMAAPLARHIVRVMQDVAS